MTSRAVAAYVLAAALLAFVAVTVDWYAVAICVFVGALVAVVVYAHERRNIP